MLQNNDSRVSGGRSDLPAVITIFGGSVMFGQERANIEVLSALKNAGCDVTVVMRSDKLPEVDKFHEEFKSLGFKVVQQPFADPKGLRMKRTTLLNSIAGLFLPSIAIKKLVDERRKPVLYLFNCYFVLTIIWYLIAARTPVVYRAGDVPATHSAFTRMLWAIIRRRVVRAVAVSEYIKRQLVEVGLSDKIISVIYSRPRLPPRESLVEKFDVPDGLPTIVYVGQINEEKGVGVLAEAFERISKDHPCRLVVVGRVNPNLNADAFASALRERLAQSKVSSRVEFPGYVDDVYRYLRTARVHVQPSVWDEPLANTVMEAKRVGVPSIVFPSGGLPEVVCDGVDGTICRDKTVDALVDALRPYLEDIDLARQRGAAAEASLTDLGVARFESAWLEVFQEAASK